MNTGNPWKKFLYTVYSPIYDPIVKLLSPRRGRAFSLLNIAPKDEVLIVGAGTGLDLPFLPAHANYTAIDLTPAMLGHLKAKAAKLNLPVKALEMDGHALQFPNNTFDKVVLHFIVAVIPDPYRCLREVERVLKPGGKAVIYDKFLPDEQQAAWWRKLLNNITNPLATDINRQIGDLLSVTNLRKIHDEKANLGGVFRIIVVEKTLPKTITPPTR